MLNEDVDTFVVAWGICTKRDQHQAFCVCSRSITGAKRDHWRSTSSQLFAESDGTHVVFERWPDGATHDACTLPANDSGLDTDHRGLCREEQKTAEMEPIGSAEPESRPAIALTCHLCEWLVSSAPPPILLYHAV